MGTVLRRVAGAGVVLGVLLAVSGCDTGGAPQGFDPGADLAKDRAGKGTKLRVQGKSPQEFQAERPPAGVKEVEFASGALKLKAWVTEAPGDGTKRPAVVFCHGGFAFGGEDVEQARPFVDAGYVVMVPTWRGENGGPGSFEMFYGEVDDAIAAGKYLAAVPGVDPKRVFIAGHSSGGTIAMLAACLPGPFAGAAAYGGSPDQELFLEAPQWRQIAPFDPGDAGEVRLRSAKWYVGNLRCPLHVFAGSKDRFARVASKGMDAAAKMGGKTCTINVVDGDHFDSVPESMRKTIELFGRAGGS